MMKARKLVGRLAVAAVLVGMMVVLTAAPAFPAQPEAGTISTGSGVQVWIGHSCSANVPVSIAGLSAGLGGYETKVGWDPARFSSADADIAINIGTYLTNGGTRQQTGDSSTPALKAVSSGAVKYGAYSWGAGNPPGNQANGQLSTVSIKPTAICGNATLTMAETQLVDINGALIQLTNQLGSTVGVYNQYDITGSGAFINSSDVLAVVDHLGPRVSGCSAGYQYDANGDNSPFINSADVLAVVDHLGPTGCQ